jgi:hypothetical protein
LPSSLRTIQCASWLIYATNATDEDAKRVRKLILNIKTDSIQRGTGVPYVQAIVDAITSRHLNEGDRAAFEGHPMLVPVPGAGLTKPNSVWPSKRVCEELVRHGLGDDILPVVTRTTAVPKSAGSRARPSLKTHVESLSVQPGLTPPTRLIVVDDVVTSGTTMLACAIKLAEAFPGVPISGFALSRVQTAGNPLKVVAPLIERVVISGIRCSRGPLS